MSFNLYVCSGKIGCMRALRMVFNPKPNVFAPKDRRIRTGEGGGGCKYPPLIKRSARSNQIQQDKKNQRKGMNESTFSCFLKVRSSLKCTPRMKSCVRSCNTFKVLE